MKTLKFNKKYYMPLLTGEKTQTIRKNKKRIRTGETIKAIFLGTPMECKLKITRIGYKQFKYLTDDDARREGFNNLDELKEELINIYPRLDNLTRIYFYQFKCID